MPTADENQTLKKRRTEVSARERFMQELAKFASDDEDADAGPLGSRAPGQRPSLLAAPSSDVSAPSFFGDADDADVTAGGHGHGVVPSGGPDNAPKQVGHALLQSMHDTLSTHPVHGTTKPMKKVETYVPLSSGGFLDADAEHGDLRNVKAGDVLVALRLPSHTAPVHAASQSKHASPSTASPQPEPSYSSPTSTAPAVPPSAVVAAAVNRRILSHFRAEASMSEEEKLYGKKPTADMVMSLLTVARVDKTTATLEGVFLDGSRAKLRFHDVRPAGFVEKALYQKWKADPSSRPIKVIGGATSAENPSEAPPHAASGDAATTSSPPPPPASTSGEAVEWWVLPNLVVRVVAPDAGEWYGQKGVVTSVRRKESTVRLMKVEAWEKQAPQAPTPRSAAGTSGTGPPSIHDCVDVQGLAGLETVLPKKGETGMIVLGDRKGDMATVLARLRKEDGDLLALEVKCGRTGDIFRLQPQELCALARR